MTLNKCCNREKLQQLFDDQLQGEIEREMTDHVATCPECQQELESLAASNQWWREATDRLTKCSAETRSLQLPALARLASELNAPVNHQSSEIPFENKISQHCLTASPDNRPEDAYFTDFAVDFLEPSDEASSLGRLGEYEIVEIIGRGGMGIVLKGYQKGLNRFVAVKVLAPYLASSGAARRRFAREAQATAAVVHPHVMSIHSVHSDFKLPYLVMPYVACESLQQRLDRHGALDLKDILRIGMQTAQGLAAANFQGLVHRDVKPANILLETNVDRVMLTDFGLARTVDDATLTRTGTIAGTPQYMSPEQACGDPVDHRSDLFSLGSVLYAMSAGRPPFRAETAFGVLRRIRETEPRSIREVNCDIPEWFERIVQKLLEKNPKNRFESAIEVASLLEQCLAHVQQPKFIPLPIAASVNATQTSPSKTKSTRSILIRNLVLVTTVLLLVMTLFAFWPRSRVIESAATSIQSEEPQGQLFHWAETQNELNDLSRSLNWLEYSMKSDLISEDENNGNE